jgi:hypothetical protein
MTGSFEKGQEAKATTGCGYPMAGILGGEIGCVKKPPEGLLLFDLNLTGQ